MNHQDLDKSAARTPALDLVPQIPEITPEMSQDRSCLHLQVSSENEQKGSPEEKKGTFHFALMFHRETSCKLLD